MTLKMYKVKCEVIVLCLILSLFFFPFIHIYVCMYDKVFQAYFNNSFPLSPRVTSHLFLS